MNILLINDNPVVSRLLALCTRDKGMVLEEVQKVDSLAHATYDVVFIDEGSYKGEVMHLSEVLDIGKKILLSNSDVEINDFDMTIKKPFLPSQIIEVLDNIDTHEIVKKEISTIFPLSAEEEAVEQTDISSSQILDREELEKIKELLKEDDNIIVSNDELSEEEIASQKIEVIKQQLIADGLEIVEENEIIDTLSRKDEVVVFSSEENSKNIPSKHKKKKSKNKKKKPVVFSEKERQHIEDAVQVALATLKRKQMKKLLKGKKVEIAIKLKGKA